MADPVSIDWNSLQTNNKTTPNVKKDWSETSKIAEGFAGITKEGIEKRGNSVSRRSKSVSYLRKGIKGIGVDTSTAHYTNKPFIPH